MHHALELYSSEQRRELQVMMCYLTYYPFGKLSPEQITSFKESIGKFAHMVSNYNHSCITPDRNVEDADDSPA
jgi:hypothetical protein